MVYLVWRTPRPWEDDHSYLDSVWMTLAEALERVDQFDRITERYKSTAWVDPVHAGQPFDKSVIGE